MKTGSFCFTLLFIEAQWQETYVTLMVYLAKFMTCHRLGPKCEIFETVFGRWILLSSELQSHAHSLR